MPGVQYKDRVIEAQLYKSDRQGPFERKLRRSAGYSRGDAYLAAAGASNPSRTLRRAAKRSETAGGLVERETDAIRASGFCGMRFGHVRAWAMTDSLRSVLQWRQR